MHEVIYGTTTETEYKGIIFHMHQPDFDILHSHNAYEFMLVLEGSYLNVINDKTEVLNAGSAILLGPNDSHKIILNEQNSMHLNIMIEKKKFESICDSISENALQIISKNFPLNCSFDSQITFKILSYLDTIKIVKDDTIEILSSIIVYTILEHFLSNCIAYSFLTYPKHFVRILNECNSYKNLSWKTTDVAEYASYSQAHLNRLFKKYLNMSVIEYLTKIKMDAAKNMLLTTNYSISEIANTLGYSSLSYFNKIFYKNFKSTPYKYKLNYFKAKGHL